MILQIKPVLKSKIWGGERIKELFQIPTDLKSVGECWGISAYPGSESVVTNIPYAGKTLKQLWEEEKPLFGNHPSKEFPILVKIIEAKDDLSIQVHPDDAYAKQFGSFGKTEYWHILEADKDAQIIIGHKAKTKEEFVSLVNANRYLDLVNTYPLNKGDGYFIQPGTIHAICKGTVLLEVQQSSDITYRFYDYDRLENGKPRQLHLKEAIEVTNIPDLGVVTDSANPYFTLERLTKFGRNNASLYGDYLIVTEGKGIINDEPIQKGSFVIATSKQIYMLKGKMEVFRVRLK
jgi:mannose-6-phosphate isomerase